MAFPGFQLSKSFTPGPAYIARTFRSRMFSPPPPTFNPFLRLCLHMYSTLKYYAKNIIAHAKYMKDSQNKMRLSHKLASNRHKIVRKLFAGSAFSEIFLIYQ